MIQGKKERKFQSVSSGSTMADVGFLLLIFFITATIFPNDKGIRVTLPPYTEEDVPIIIKERNVLNIMINADGAILADGKKMKLEDLQQTTKDFITNPNKDEHLSEQPTKAIVALQHDRGTIYETYIGVYDQLMAAYNELWETAAQERFKRSFASLTKLEQRKIKKEIPLVISESEPTAFGIES